MPFEDIKEGKKKKIVEAALEEFAEHGYEKASTNRIVYQAGVGKGMLYYYFENKRKLYLYLVKNSLDVIEDQYIKHIDISETDVFERMRQIAEFEMRVYSKNYHFFNFMSSVFINEDFVLTDDLKGRIEKLQDEGMAKLYQNIDFSKFRDDIDVNKAFKLIQWAINGYQNDLINRLKGVNFNHLDFEYYMDEFLEYLEVLKIGFYK
ncbi:TetR/AcrR family transcriptional regulator [Tenuibacillus multivorans]|uniref:DNA-binding transcriptional regulator, AcrR family n=1 Tax=Tenuibacillus multivorans TaxID=237069 RepID=A0A1H0AL94_9BACI|nr:TetR/AcrR family transcriptional regulator [Tenuibacillus multivorans]GEL78196.1 TetR family transcriptional regulator [Tenuibacillus multivorans]SDN34352.1 DNA-binding transcriptional regulator, AcrR family [Tenuibacillus multivorans]